MRIATLGLLICFGLACGNQSRLNKVENDGDPVYEMEGEDEIMDASIRMAKASYDDFEKEWKKHDSANSHYNVKVEFKDAEGYGEHMWLIDLFAKGDTMYGILDNDPIKEVGVAAGDTIQIKKADVSDWMYVRNGKLVGGYTMKVLYSRMNDQERQQFLREVPFFLQ